jgi:Spy/CpxP family protein refolding chaperone
VNSLIRRSLLSLITAFLLLPLSGIAQEQQNQQQTPSQSQTPQTQTDNQQQQPRGRLGHRGERMQMMAEKLNLTDQQKQQVKDLRQKTMEQARAIRNDSSLSDADKKQKLQDLHKQTREQFLSMLTPEQKQQLKEMRQEHMKKRQGKDGDNSKPDDTSKGPGI